MEIETQLQSKLKAQLDKITVEDHEQWMAHPCTKAVLLGLENDYFDLQTSWASGRYATNEAEGHNALGQAQYIAYNREAIHSMVKRDE